MLSTQILFIALCFSYFLSLTFLTYFIKHKNNIKANYEMNKLKKFILAYVLPTIFSLLVIYFLAYLAFIDLFITFFVGIAGAVYVFGVFLIIEDAPYCGLFLTIASIAAFACIFSINFTDKEQDAEIFAYELYNYKMEDPNREEILIILDDTDSESNLVHYAFMQYNKLDVLKIEEKENIEIGFLLQTSNYELIDDTYERFEIIKQSIESHDIYSYFRFTKPDISYEYSYKVLINEESIRLD